MLRWRFLYDDVKSCLEGSPAFISFHLYNFFPFTAFHAHYTICMISREKYPSSSASLEIPPLACHRWLCASCWMGKQGRGSHKNKVENVLWLPESISSKINSTAFRHRINFFHVNIWCFWCFNEDIRAYILVKNEKLLETLATKGKHTFFL